MPINSIQYRAEIGLFYNTLHRFVFIKTPIPSFVRNFLLEYLPHKCMKLSEIFPSPCHLLSCMALFLIFPFILLFALSFSNTIHVSRLSIVSYLYTYIFFALFVTYFGLPLLVVGLSPGS